MKTFNPRPQITNLRLFVGVIFGLFGFLTGTLLGLTLLKKQAFISIIVGIVLFGLGLLVRSEWKQWKEWMKPFTTLGCFMVGFAVGIGIFAVTRDE